MGIGGIGVPINQGTIDTISSALGEVADGISARGTLGIAEAESAFQPFVAQDFAGIPAQSSNVSNPAYYPSPAEAYSSMLGSDPAQIPNFSSIVNPFDVNGFIADRNFNPDQVLANFVSSMPANELFGPEGLFASVAGNTGLAGTGDGTGSALQTVGGMFGGPLPRHVDLGTSVEQANTERLAQPPWMTDVTLADGSNPISISSNNSQIAGGASNPLVYFGRMGSFDGLSNLNGETPEGQQNLTIFNDQMRALTGFESVVGEQVGLSQQFQNFQNFRGGKILG